jgi:peptidase E
MTEKETSSLLATPGLKLVMAGAGSDTMKSPDTIILDTALDISGAPRPTVLTIGTAEPTADYFNEFTENTKRQFGGLGAGVVNLHEFKTAPSEAELQDKIGSADIVWVAGGNTKEAMKFWEQYGITKALSEAALRGVVLAGGSAGFLAWTEQGFSDSLSYEVPEGEPWEYVFVKGMGMVRATGIPHFDTNKEGTDKKRRDFFMEEFTKNNPNLPNHAIGIDNAGALVLVDGQYQVVKRQDAQFPNGDVHIITKNSDGMLSTEILPVNKDLKKLEL